MIIHVVESGDTINLIAEKYNTTSEKLIIENGVENPENLVIGQTVVITEPSELRLRTIVTNGYVYPFVDETVLKKNLLYSTLVSIFTYGFTSEGELVPLDDLEIISKAYSTSTSPFMVLSTLTEEGVFSNEVAHSIFTNPTAQNNLINNIIRNLRQKEYFGVDIDFEFVAPEDKDAYVEFIRNTRIRLNSLGYYVMVSLAPKVSSDQPGLLYEAHDYNAIGEAANLVLIMTYEWGYTYGPPMPVAPINKVQEVLDYAITEIPPDRILMGIPNYGYDWALPYIQGETKATKISNTQAIEIAAEVGAIIQFDELAQTPFFEYTDSTGIDHIVYFEDARSIYAKLLLVDKYNFLGVGYWNYMSYFPQNWSVLTSLYNIYSLGNNF